MSIIVHWRALEYHCRWSICKHWRKYSVSVRFTACIDWERISSNWVSCWSFGRRDDIALELTFYQWWSQRMLEEEDYWSIERVCPITFCLLTRLLEKRSMVHWQRWPVNTLSWLLIYMNRLEWLNKFQWMDEVDEKACERIEGKYNIWVWNPSKLGLITMGFPFSDHLCKEKIKVGRVKFLEAFNCEQLTTTLNRTYWRSQWW